MCRRGKRDFLNEEKIGLGTREIIAVDQPGPVGVRKMEGVKLRATVCQEAPKVGPVYGKDIGKRDTPKWDRRISYESLNLFCYGGQDRGGLFL